MTEHDRSLSDMFEQERRKLEEQRIAAEQNVARRVAEEAGWLAVDAEYEPKIQEARSLTRQLAIAAVAPLVQRGALLTEYAYKTEPEHVYSKRGRLKKVIPPERVVVLRGWQISKTRINNGWDSLAIKPSGHLVRVQENRALERGYKGGPEPDSYIEALYNQRVSVEPYDQREPSLRHSASFPRSGESRLDRERQVQQQVVSYLVAHGVDLDI